MFVAVDACVHSHQNTRDATTIPCRFRFRLDFLNQLDELARAFVRRRHGDYLPHTRCCSWGLLATTSTLITLDHGDSFVGRFVARKFLVPCVTVIRWPHHSKCTTSRIASVIGDERGSGTHLLDNSRGKTNKTMS